MHVHIHTHTLPTVLDADEATEGSFFHKVIRAQRMLKHD